MFDFASAYMSMVRKCEKDEDIQTWSGWFELGASNRWSALGGPDHPGSGKAMRWCKQLRWFKFMKMP